MSTQPLTHQEVWPRLKVIAEESLGAEIRLLDTPQDCGADSLSMSDFFWNLEDEFGIKIPAEHPMRQYGIQGKTWAEISVLVKELTEKPNPETEVP
jgi:acyl carrier protein